MPSEWTVDTLKEYMDTRFEYIKDAINKADIVAEQRANELKSETQAKFDNVNEWRVTVQDLQANFMPRNEFDTAIKVLQDKIDAKNVQIFLSLSVGFVAVLIAVFNFALGL